jgi:replicative DNA helicase
MEHVVRASTLRDHALAYAGIGIEVFPVHPQTKAPLTAHGMKDATTDTEQIDAWWKTFPDASIGGRIPTDVVVVDVDPKGGGDGTWRALCAHFGKPDTRTHYSGRGDGGGHVWFTCPLQRCEKFSTRKLDAWCKQHGLERVGIDILHHGHRYTILPPSLHAATGLPYRWKGDGLAIEAKPIDAWLRGLVVEQVERPATSQPTLMDAGDSIADWYTETHSWNDILPRHGWQLVRGDGDSDGSAWTHPDATNDKSATITHGCLFVYSPNTPFDVTEDGDPNGYTRFRAYAVLEHKGNMSDAARAARELRDGRRDLLRALTADDLLDSAGTQTRDAADSSTDIRDRFVDGESFLSDAPEDVPAVWGRGDDVLWAEDESLLLVGPPGVGKTTLAHQLVFGRIGLLDRVLDLPVTQTAKRVLYLACDRPAQIARAMRRLALPDDGDALRERLIVWKGPPPEDVAANTKLLHELAVAADADTIVIDSLKDIAIGLSEDAIGAAVNTAIQRCIAVGIQVLVLHHQRKKGGDGAKPKKLDDVYGSTWISAGAGSVLLLWGEAGDPIVELIQLKPAAGDIGPWKIEHDHFAGRSTIWHGFDLISYLRTHPEGASIAQLARACFDKSDPTDNERKKIERRIKALGDRIERDDPVMGGSGGSQGARYRLADPVLDVAAAS